MQARFHTRKGIYRRDGLHWPGTAAHLWPFARALVGTLDLAGLADGRPGDIDTAGLIAEQLQTLERYWEVSRGARAYSSDLPGKGPGGDRYYDDNAWVGLALVQLERMRPSAGDLGRAGELFRFAQAGWDDRPDVPSPGGVFWVEQGVGTGARNHDRNTVSNAPNAALGLHLAELTGARADLTGPIGPIEMYDWVNAALSADRDADRPGTGLFQDKLRGDGSLDRALWSYNQGNMIGVNVLLARRPGHEPGEYLERAETIARRALRHYADIGYDGQPAAFNAIFFRNLLQLHAVTADDRLRTEIIEAMRAYVERTWNERRTRSDCFRLSGRGITLLDQSAMVQMLALLAWDPGDYHKLA